MYLIIWNICLVKHNHSIQYMRGIIKNRKPTDTLSTNSSRSTMTFGYRCTPMDDMSYDCWSSSFSLTLRTCKKEYQKDYVVNCFHDHLFGDWE